MKIVVFDNQIEAALKQLKKQMQKDGLFQEMKRRAHYEKPSVKRKRKQAHARKKLRRPLQGARPVDGDWSARSAPGRRSSHRSGRGRPAAQRGDDTARR